MKGDDVFVKGLKMIFIIGLLILIFNGFSGWESAVWAEDCTLDFGEGSYPRYFTIDCDHLSANYGMIKRLEQKIQSLERRIYELEKDKRCNSGNYFDDDCKLTFKLLGK